MRFGSFIVPVSHDPDNDAQVIEETLREIETLEEAGVDVAFLSEHHIDGECAYADPLVFGGAVAARTSHIKIGFAVIKMTIHNPVHLAIQLSLLDNLSGGRVIVGTARGSRSKYYEYTAFGTTMEAGLERLDEAEELLVKTWTAKDLDFQGTHWQVRVPDIRPRPVQKPHPPLLRGCLTEGLGGRDGAHRPAHHARLRLQCGDQGPPLGLSHDHARVGLRRGDHPAHRGPELGRQDPLGRRFARRSSRDHRARLP